MGKNSTPPRYVHMSYTEAFKHIEHDTFKLLGNPSPQMMWALIKGLPISIARMPQAQTKPFQREALRCDGKLLGLGRSLPWTFETEYEFPGSTAWASHNEVQLHDYCKNLNLKQQRMLDQSWQLVSKFADRPQWAISQKTRDLLISLPYPLGSELIRKLLDLPIGEEPPPMPNSVSFASALAHALA